MVTFNKNNIFINKNKQIKKTIKTWQYYTQMYQ